MATVIERPKRALRRLLPELSMTIYLIRGRKQHLHSTKIALAPEDRDRPRTQRHQITLNHNIEKDGHAYSRKHYLGNYAAVPKRIKFPACGLKSDPGSAQAAPHSSKKCKSEASNSYLSELTTSDAVSADPGKGKIVLVCSYFAELQANNLYYKAFSRQ
jgi:hypothetical protein